MKTECNGKGHPLQPLGRRAVVADFEGGRIASEAGAVLLRELESKRGMVRQLAECFVDYRDRDRREHTVEELVKQRVYGLAWGCEDWNDHDRLRQDPLVALLVGKEEVEGRDRRRERDRGKALAGKSTWNRLELTPEGAGPEARYKKIGMKTEAVERLGVEMFIQSHPQAPEDLVLDVDATDDPVQGEQEGRFFHGDYREDCYLPLSLVCEGQGLCARLRSSNMDASEGGVEELKRIVGQLREAWPQVKITVRGDSGLAREALTSWCESEKVG